MKHFSLQNNF